MFVFSRDPIIFLTVLIISGLYGGGEILPPLAGSRPPARFARRAGEAGNNYIIKIEAGELSIITILRSQSAVSTQNCRGVMYKILASYKRF